MGCRGKIGKVFMFVFALSIFFFISPGSGFSASLSPDIQQLSGITISKEVLWSPGRLAVGADGTLYVVDSYKNHILKFDRDGNYLGDISYPRVSAIAVTPDGTLYIGSHQDYAVSIINNGQVIGHLGAAKDEFRSIRDIAYDPSTGHIYVADNVGNAVRIFDAAGRDLGSIAGVNLPICVEVTADYIYVIDAPVVKEQQGRTTASRISIFDKTHNLVSSIDDYGKNQMFRPTDIAIANGILYITDAALQSVVLFDVSGNLLGDIQSIAGPMRPAVSLAISSDGILYVSSSQTQGIQVFAIGGQQ